MRSTLHGARHINIEFPGKTVIVTGAAHGFGRAISLAFAQRGAQVWACDILANELLETRQLCVNSGGSCEVRTVDVAQREHVFKFVKKALNTSTQIDILVNNAGGVLGQVGRPLEDVSQADWQRIFDVNVSVTVIKQLLKINHYRQRNAQKKSP